VYVKTVICSWIFLLYPTEYNVVSPFGVGESMTQIVSKYDFREETIDISGVKIHYVITDNLANSDADDILVFIHGTASCSVTFFDIMKVLSRTHRQKCVAIDLPTFGISGHIDTERYKTNQELCECYADIIGNTLQALNILKKTTLVAHSLGGYLSIYVADRFPIKKLVLLNPAGILPTLGEWGYYWGLFFKTGLPTTAFHLPLVSRDGLVNMGKAICGSGGANGSIENDITTDFWLSFYANPANEAHRILQRLITIRPFHSYWNTPALMTLLDGCKKVATTVCFGEADTIIPSHIGGFIDEVTQGEIMIHIVKNANHNPCVNITRMKDILLSIVNDSQHLRSLPRRIRAKLQKSGICRGFSYHSLEKTGNSFQHIYDYLLTHITYCPPHSASPP